jgi:hypothetical protein
MSGTEIDSDAAQAVVVVLAVGRCRARSVIGADIIVGMRGIHMLNDGPGGCRGVYEYSTMRETTAEEGKSQHDEPDTPEKARGHEIAPI